MNLKSARILMFNNSINEISLMIIDANDNHINEAFFDCSFMILIMINENFNYPRLKSEFEGLNPLFRAHFRCQMSFFIATTAQTTQSQQWFFEVRQSWTCKSKIIRLGCHGIYWDIRKQINKRREHGYVHNNISMFSLMLPINSIHDHFTLMLLITSLMKPLTYDGFILNHALQLISH